MIYIPAIIAFILLFLDVPVGLSLLSSALIFFGFMTNDLPLTSVVQRVVSCNMSSSLLTIPCFLMVGTRKGGPCPGQRAAEHGQRRHVRLQRSRCGSPVQDPGP